MRNPIRNRTLKNTASCLIYLSLPISAGCETASPFNLPGSNNPTETVARLAQVDVSEELRDAGDGCASRRLAIPLLFPEIARLANDPQTAGPALQDRFVGQPTADQELGLVLCAYALEDMNYVMSLPALVQFLQNNINGEVPDAVVAVTHTLRRMLERTAHPYDDPSPPNATAYYSASEIEETMVLLENATITSGDAGADSRSKGVSITIADAKRSSMAKDPVRASCRREFVIRDAFGRPIQDANGNEIVISGTVENPDANPNFSTTSAAKNLAARVVAEDGTYVSQVDPMSGFRYEGRPSKRFNCAGYAFRVFNGGYPWRADPEDMRASLVAAGVLEEIDQRQAVEGDFVFFFQGDSDSSSHVAVVHEAGFFGAETVINADGPTGLFTAPLDSEWLQRYNNGSKFYRWKDGAPPSFATVTDRDAANSCFGYDGNQDGWPDEPCDAQPDCIDSAFSENNDGNDGSTGPTGYRIYRVVQIGQLEVMPDGSENEDIPLCGFSGGGLDCTVMADFESITDAYPTKAEAAESLCTRISNVRRLPLLSSPGADFDGELTLISWALYDLFQPCDE